MIERPLTNGFGVLATRHYLVCLYIEMPYGFVIDSTNVLLLNPSMSDILPDPTVNSSKTFFKEGMFQYPLLFLRKVDRTDPCCYKCNTTIEQTDKSALRWVDTGGYYSNNLDMTKMVLVLCSSCKDELLSPWMKPLPTPSSRELRRIQRDNRSIQRRWDERAWKHGTEDVEPENDDFFRNEDGE